MSDLVGQKLGQYEITSLIGRGGMATVYLAQQPSMARSVAVKVLPPQLMHDDTFLKRFKREVQAIARLQHPRIIPVYDYGEENGTLYIVMAYIKGGSLAEAIKARGPLPLDETRRIIGQIAEGLDFAHNQGVIHRDFKPSNVLLDAGNNAYLSDFGIAKVSQETAQLTGSGIVGTPTYMAPEMFKAEEPTPSVDIYALGITLYQMLSGDAPYSGTTPVQLMYAHLTEPIPSIAAARPDLPPAVQIVIDRAMAKTPAARYPTALQMVDELDKAEAGDLAALEDSTIPLSMPLTPDLAVAGTATASPAPTGKVEETLPPAAPKVDEMALKEERERKVDEMALKGERERKESRKRPRDREGRPRRRHMWVLWVILALLIFGGVCKGIGTIRDSVTSAVGNAAGNMPFEGTPVSGEIHQALQDATSLEVTISVGTGDVYISSLSEDQVAASGDFSGRGQVGLDQSYTVRDGKGVLDISQKSTTSENPAFLETLTLDLTDAIPIDLTFNAGAGTSDIDLSELTLTALRVKGGAGSFTITLPETGNYNVDATAGMGEIILLIPDGVEARVDVNGGLSNIDIADERFSETSDKVWETPGYADAKERVRISLTTGLGQVKVDRP